jgi:hypothetical protein
MREAVQLRPHRLDDAGMPIPPPKSISRLPSASVTTAPSACTTAMGVTAGTPRGTAAARRASNARLFGPGISVRIWMTPAIVASRDRDGVEGRRKILLATAGSV